MLEMRKEQVAKQVEEFNASSGDLNQKDGYDCPLCKNRGMFEELEPDEITTKIVFCECQRKRMEKAKADRMLQESGLAQMIEDCTFQKFEMKEQWQKVFVEKACEYVRGEGAPWFFAGGQPGAGKTHICTAICRSFLKKGIPVRYMLWADESRKLKSIVTYAEQYKAEIEPLKSVDVLYIDDLFKVQRDGSGKYVPTAGDINLAFEIINARYMRKDLKTIISCEWMISDLIAMDEALGSRISERSKGSAIQIKRDAKKNYRLGGDEIL